MKGKQRVVQGGNVGVEKHGVTGQCQRLKLRCVFYEVCVCLVMFLSHLRFSRSLQCNACQAGGTAQTLVLSRIQPIIYI